jgi:hypothetical protein
MYRKIHSRSHGESAYLSVYKHERDTIIIPVLENGNHVLMSSILKYNVYLKNSDIPVILSAFDAIRTDQMILIDKVVVIYMYGAKILSHYISVANYVYDNLAEISLQIKRGRVDISSHYLELCKSGLKYTIVKLHPNKDELIALLN